MLFCGCLPLVMGQTEGDSELREVLELWAEQQDEESVAEEWIEQLQALLENPLNLNDTNREALMLLPMMDEFKYEVLCAYILQNGPLASLSELYLMNGFDSTTIARLRPFVVVRPVEEQRPSFVEMLRRGHSNLRFGSKTVRPLSRGYEEEIYKGDPFRLYFRYQYRYGNRIVLQVSGDKDAGESFRIGSSEGDFKAQQGFDYYGYYLMLNDFGVLKRAIVGKYQLQFGQGASLWSGFAPWVSDNMPLRRYGQGIRPASAFCEYGYLRGAAATVALPVLGNIGSMELTLFYSNTDRDATLQSDTSLAGTVQYQSFYESGYHRSENEMSKKGLLNEQLLGGHLEYRSGRLIVGGTAYTTSLSAPIVPVDYVYNAFAFSGDRNFNAGVDATYRFRRLMLFGEVAMAGNTELRQLASYSGWLPLAAVAGLQFQPDGNNKFSLVMHYGSPTYQNLHASIVGQGNSVQNQLGVQSYLKLRLPFMMNFRALTDVFRYPWMRYRVYSPSVGSDCRLWLSKEVADYTVLELHYRHHVAQRNSDAQLYYVEQTRRQYLRLSLSYQPGVWHLVSRVMLSWFDCDDHQPQQGFLLFQEASYHNALWGKPFTLGGHMAIFDVSDYDARIYNYEPDLVYELTVPMLNGRGVRCGVLMRCDLTAALSLAVKYAMAIYPEAETLGSGYDRIEGPLRHEIKMQMRLKF